MVEAILLHQIRKAASGVFYKKAVYLRRRIAEFVTDLTERNGAVIVADIIGNLRDFILIRGVSAADAR